MKTHFNKPTEHAICMSVNNRFLSHFKEALTSLFTNFPHHPDIHVIADTDINPSYLPYKDQVTYHVNNLDDIYANGDMP